MTTVSPRPGACMIMFAVVRDREAFRTVYVEPLMAMLDRFRGRFLTCSQVAAVLEGGLPTATVVLISQWPDPATADAFWNSAEHQALLAARGPLAVAVSVVTETCPNPPISASTD